MFGRLSERAVAVIRWVLVSAWIVLIISLFYDPLSPSLTRPDNLSSPFRLNPAESHGAGRAAMDWACPIWVKEGGGARIDWKGSRDGECDPRCTRVQGRCLIEQPYAMGARILWTMVIPVLPLFFMLFGHEAWRRICPLSALSQLPRRLGIQRRSLTLNERSGRVERRLALVSAESFWARNVWFVQFGLLCLAVSIRLVAINSDRIALAAFLLGVILVALIVGALFGGKTWCHYVCPIAPVQRIYTEPRGLLESEAHTGHAKLTQSSCRKTDRKGEEVSICVGCVSPCPDINLERQYWQRLDQPGRRFVHYGYVGMILGFYCYYALYSGNWRYYFSGAWTHEEDQLSQIWAPGFSFLEGAFPIPKLIAAPLTIAGFVFAAYVVGRFLEGVWSGWRTRRGRPVSAEERVHRTGILSAAVAINCFYLFGGRPNLELLPPLLGSLVDVFIVSVSALWVARSWTRTSDRYARESVAEGLRRQLAALSVDLKKILGGRSVEQLNTDEVYALARTLPALSLDERRKAYKAMLRDALVRGMLGTAAGAELVRQIGEQMEISEDEHRQILAELGVEDPTLLDPHRVVDEENRWRVSGYRDSIAALLESGRSGREAIGESSVEIGRLQGAYRITAEEHESVMAELTGSSSRLVSRAEERIERLSELDAFLAGLKHLALEVEGLSVLRSEIEVEKRHELERIFNILMSLGNDTQAHQVARKAAVSSPDAVAGLLATVRRDGGASSWSEALHPVLVEILEGQVGERLRVEESATFLDLRSEEGARVLERTIGEWRPVARASALAVLAAVNASRGSTVARKLLAGESETHHWLVVEVAAAIAEGRKESSTSLEILGRLQRAELFRSAEVEALARLARTAKLEVHRRGDVLCRQGDVGGDVFVLTRGLADVVLEGTEQIKLSVVRPGQSVGELSLLTGAPRTASVLAAEEGTELVRLDGRAFNQYLERDARELLRIVSERLVRTTGQLKDRPARVLPVVSE
ncbi:MAG: cyclic nucleotide-binding domain-containing protein [Deltaproteobacteria bacterium]|nr:cyclic nucleotide-binding domain-containing protein [Deltaproteobacteria bacterium]